MTSDEMDLDNRRLQFQENARWAVEKALHMASLGLLSGPLLSTAQELLGFVEPGI